MVLVDKISGGKSKVWVWQLGGGAGKDRNADPGNLPNTTVEGNTFTIKKPDGATFRGTFVTPDNVKLTAEIRQTAMIGGAGSSRDQTLERSIPGLFATGGDNFFVVATLQRGDPPPVKITGAGLDAIVTIGKRTIRFDGKKIALGE
jgi:hypothetical protein